MNEELLKMVAGRLERVGKILEKLPAEVRIDAFDLLKGFVTASSPELPGKSHSKPKPTGEDLDDATFFSSFNHDKPADNVKLIAAYFYKEHGVEPFSIEDARQKADEVGITVPARLDMTFLQAKEKGKKLFIRAGLGKFKPTVYGESHFKSVYNVKKGTKKRAGASE